MKQDENSPLSVEAQTALLYIANAGALDDVPVEKVRSFEAQWHDYAAANLPDVLQSIAEAGELSDENTAKLDEAVSAFKQTVSL